MAQAPKYIKMCSSMGNGVLQLLVHFWKGFNEVTRFFLYPTANLTQYKNRQFLDQRIQEVAVFITGINFAHNYRKKYII